MTQTPTGGPESQDGPDVPQDEHLDGHTMEELGEYLDRGRSPRDPSIENSAACQLALQALGRLRDLSFDALDARAAEARTDAARDDAWISGLLDSIRSEVRPGRDIPVSHPDPALRLSLTEAAARGIVRRTVDTVGGLITGRVVLVGDVTAPGAPIRIRVAVSLEYGKRLAPILGELRERILAEVQRHTELAVTDIDVRVEDLYEPRGGTR